MIRGERAVELRSPWAGPSIASLWLQSKETARPKSRREEMLGASPRALTRGNPQSILLLSLYALRSPSCDCEAYRQLRMTLSANSEQV